ncbi:MAG TPA: S8 family serine peptidase [Candidatus Limnocylindrales bacterium]|nr:S8 family serine peptidase [Candidatus Limnocylindrales bacterium]
MTVPTWSQAFTAGNRGLGRLNRRRPFGRVEREAAFGGVDGSGLTVAVIDSGIEVNHPAIGGRLVQSVRVELADGRPVVVGDDGQDVVGHGTAVGGIIHSIAPAADLVSIRVLGPDNRGKGEAFLTALDWAIGQGVSVVNLSLSSKSEALYADFHALADRAYFSNVLLVSAANNVPGPSYPSLFAAVVSVAAHDVRDPSVWFYNPEPPVEFGAYGIDVSVAWRAGGRSVVTGNSFAAPHIAGVATLIRSKHPGISPFETKALLAATANDPDER